jgi:SAM-dependent methyltransferase
MMSKYTGSAKFIEDQLSIIGKDGVERPFILNNIQARFVQQATGRDVILKARQMGFSSFILAAFTKDFILKENSLSVVLADKADNAQDLLARVKYYIKSYEQKNNVKVPLKYNSKYELQNAHNSSRYIIGTAENEEFGRSKTIFNLHMSEAAFYKNFDKILASAGTALVPDGRFVVETTANGFNDFKDFWDKSYIGESGFTTHFFSGEDFYSKEYLDSEKQRLGRLFVQEYPMTAEEAFLTSGDCFFEPMFINDYKKNYERTPIEFQFINNI